MNYPESQIILNEIKKAKKILINCHTNPDADSVGSAYALNEVLKVFYKKDDVTIVCPNDLPVNTSFLKDNLVGKIDFKKIDFNKFDFSEYDLFIAIDSSSWDRVRGGGINEKIEIETIVIDHHFTNNGFGDINLVDKTMSSTAELLYFIFNDWGVDPDIEFDYPCYQTALLTGIISDTECFRTKDADNKTMKVSSDLMKYCSKDKIIKNLYQSNSISTVKSVGKILENITIDTQHGFCYAYLKYPEYVANKDELLSKDLVADFFINSIEGTKFGFVAIEKESQNISVSFRSRNNFDTSLVARELGGGGHKNRSAVTLRGIKFDDALKNVIKACQKYAKKN